MKTIANYSLLKQVWQPAALLSVAILGGCAAHPLPSYRAQEKAAPGQDMAIVDSIEDSGVRSAIVTQHVLYPYHFVPGGDMLNELGERDLAVLITHYRLVGGGDLSLRKGDASDAIYNARLQFVQKEIKSCGVEVASVHIMDTIPGGESMTSNEVVRALNKNVNQMPYLTDSGSSGSGGSGGGSGSGGSGGTPPPSGGGSQ